MRQAMPGLTLQGAGNAPALIHQIRRRYDAARAGGAALEPFDVQLPDRQEFRIGEGAPAFAIRLVDKQGERAFASFDEIAIAEAYMNGHLDITGDLLRALTCRPILSDRHPVRYLLSTFVRPLVLGQKRSDAVGISHHYDLDSSFFTLWLDKKLRCYTHGFFESDSEPLETAIERKFQFAADACGLKPGDRVLDVGGGWGAFVEFGGRQGVRVTSLTLSAESEKYINELIREQRLPCQVIRKHFLEYESGERYDAIINMGVTEHLPNYRATLARYSRLLKPGGRIYLDSLTGEKFSFSTFVRKWVFEANTSPLCLHEYLAEVARTRFEVMLVQNDRHNYDLTCRRWAENLERAREQIVQRWGEPLYRRFRLYLWASANAFRTGILSAHHLVLQLPE